MAKPYNQVVFLGDSLLQEAATLKDSFCFQAAVQTLVLRRLDVINRGFSGYNSRNVLGLLDQIFLPPSPTTPKIDYLIVLLGANDAALPSPTTPQHVPLEEYKSNLTSIITHPHIAAHAPKILIATPPPLDEIRYTAFELANGQPAARRQAAVSATYSQAARDVASSAASRGAEVVLVDLFKGLMARAVELTDGYDEKGEGERRLGYPGGRSGGLEELLTDGLHLSGEAYRVFFEVVKPHIGPFPEGTEDWPFPGWKELNPGAL